MGFWMDIHGCQLDPKIAIYVKVLAFIERVPFYKGYKNERTLINSIFIHKVAKKKTRKMVQPRNYILRHF